MERSSRQGCFVVVEGADGSGKSTLCRALVESFDQVTLTAEPSKGPIGTKIREWIGQGSDPAGFDARTFGLLFAADRRHHHETVVRPALGRGDLVICDRGLLSSIVYQVGDALESKWATDLLAFNEGAIRPDLVLLLDLPGEEAVARLVAAGRIGLDNFSKEADIRSRCGLYLAALQFAHHRRAISKSMVLDASMDSLTLRLQALDVICDELEARS